MKIKTSIKLEYKNGRFRKLTMFETDPQVAEQEVDGEVTKRRPATVQDMKIALRKSLATMMRDSKIRSFTDHETGKVVIIRFTDVDEIEIGVEEVVENEG
ncbi:hypothetical protein [Peribacillus frigoritolerans]|uniref:Uncharacterized protein n=1 Tax=Peribacillus castrilensis TaxID=2897690 RepID=A0AAW9NL91_9BACI|nr:hypothetical protein [Peribacillus castrilensis]